MRITKIMAEALFNPKAFFQSIFAKENYKEGFFYLLSISLIWYFLVFLKIIISVHNPTFFSENLSNDLLYSSFSSSAIISSLIVLFLTLLTIFLLSLFLPLIVRLFLFLFKVKITFKNLWLITAYSLTPLLIFAVLDILTVYPPLYFLRYSMYLFYFYVIFIYMTGVLVVTKIPRKKFFIILTIIGIIFTLTVSLLTIKEVRQLEEERFYSFSAKIGNDIFFTQDNIASVCKKIECIKISELDNCSENNGVWTCPYAFQVSLEDEAAKRFAEITGNLAERKIDNKDYLNETITYYLNDEKIDEALIDSNSKGNALYQIYISGHSNGKTKTDAISNAMSDLRKLQLFLSSNVK